MRAIISFASFRPRHRWFQFRLRTLLLTMFVVATPLGWRVEQVRRQRAAVEAIELAGGQVQFPPDDTVPGDTSWSFTKWLKEKFVVCPDAVTLNGLEALNASGPEFKDGDDKDGSPDSLTTTVMYGTTPPVSYFPFPNQMRQPVNREQIAAAWQAMKRFPKLRSLHLNGQVFGDDYCITLRGLTELETLFISDGGGGDALFGQVAALHRLRSLEIIRTTLNDRALTYICDLSGLESLGLDDVGPVNLVALSRLTKLRTLAIAGRSISDDEFAALGTLPDLEELVLVKAPVRTQAISHLARLPRLRDLALVDCKLDCSGDAAWRGFPCLRRIGLSGSQFATDQFPDWTDLRSLQEVDLTDTEFPNSAVPLLAKLAQVRNIWLSFDALGPTKLQQLRGALPNCQIAEHSCWCGTALLNMPAPTVPMLPSPPAQAALPMP